ncbi:MAG TPA: GNAT family protein [Glycomyces sp.]|nr:GNAT family protein [Glycomyces sp.]
MTVSAHLPIGAGDIAIRRLRHEDAEAFALGTEDEAVREYGHLPLREYTPRIVRDQIDGVIAAGLADGTLAVLAIADGASDRFLGSLVLFDFRPDRAEVGFWLAKEARGRGAAVKALDAAAALAAKAGLGLLEARTSPQNKASRRALERAGFRQSGEATAERTPSGAVVPVLRFERALTEPSDT